MNLFIYCYGGLGREVYDIAIRINQVEKKWEDINFIDDVQLDSIVKNSKKVYSFEKVNKKFERDKIEIIIANGEPKVREKLFNKIRKENINLGKLIDPSAIISPSSKIKNGAIIAPFCSIQANVQINENVLVNTGSIIGHDILVGKNSVVSSFVNIGGSSIIGEKVFLGMGCMLKENLKIGSNTIIGMGSFVHRSVGDQLIVMGNPARPIKKNEKEKIFRKK